MDLDEEVEPCVSRMVASMNEIQDKFVPQLRLLNDDVISANYEGDDLIRLHLSTAFTLTTALFSLDHLRCERHQHHRAVEGAMCSLIPCEGRCDARLLSQMEAITTAIEKLKTISALRREREEANSSPQGTEGGDTEPSAKRLKPESSEKAEEEDDAMMALLRRRPVSGKSKAIANVVTRLTK